MIGRMVERSVGLALALTLAGCGPVIEGPQLGEVPSGLAYNTSITSARPPLPGRPVARQVGYLAPGGQDWTDSVIITEYDGTVTFAEVAAARDDLEKRYGRSARYGPLEPLTIAGRPGWAFSEAQPGGALTLNGVVSLEGKTYGVELKIGRKEGRDLATMSRMVASFHVPRRRDPLPWGFVVFGAALLALTTFLARQNVSERARRGHG